MQIGFIGAGKMAQAIIKGLVLNKVVDSDDIIVNDVSIDTLSEIKTTYNVNVTASGGQTKPTIINCNITPRSEKSVLVSWETDGAIDKFKYKYF